MNKNRQVTVHVASTVDFVAYENIHIFGEDPFPRYFGEVSEVSDGYIKVKVIDESRIKSFIAHLILKPLIKRNYRLRKEGKKPDEMYWADNLCLEWNCMSVYRSIERNSQDD